MVEDRILIHLPEYYGDIEDFEELAGTETIELTLMEGAVDQLFDDQFVETSGLQAIKRRELMLGIQADPTTETLEFRRRRILNRYQTKPPFTIRYLQQQLDMLVGPGMTIVSVDYENRLLTVTANIDNASVFREVLHTIETIKPANMVYQQNTALEGGIVLEEHISMQEMVWNYKLDGSWQLGEKPFVSFKPEVPIT
ncbi:putative phage tail protein [Priestia megaterium]|uniref:putative phage tail protein n=1 Tax=Priestia megaterium TaxID=1404 RepID=UPI003D07A14F